MFRMGRTVSLSRSKPSCAPPATTPHRNLQDTGEIPLRLMNSGVHCQYATRLWPGLSFLLHSIIYEKPDVNTLEPETYNFRALAPAASATYRRCWWIFDHCPIGTTIEVYNSPIPGPYDRPAIEQTHLHRPALGSHRSGGAAQHQQ